jgi:hypothetical protein
MTPEARDQQRAINKARAHLLAQQHAANLYTSPNVPLSVAKAMGWFLFAAVMTVWIMGMFDTGIGWEALDLEWSQRNK